MYRASTLYKSVVLMRGIAFVVEFYALKKAFTKASVLGSNVNISKILT